MSKTRYPTKKAHQQLTDRLLQNVELEGVEPSSKQGNHTLSTRLFWPLVFVLWQDPDHQP